MRTPLVGLALALAACSPSASLEAPGDGPTRGIGTSTGMEVKLGNDTRVEEASINAPIDSVFVAAAEAFRALGAEINTYDPAGRIIGATGFVAPRQIAGRRLSSYVDCGSGLSGPHADNARVRLDIMTRVVPAPSGGTTLQTRVTATARPTSGASADLVGCSSTGQLEAHIARLARVRARG